MGRNIIVSEDTLRDLLEAHASLSAWYYELTNRLRAVNGSVASPDDAARSAFVQRIATDFPELASVARTIGVPRMFVPPPPAAIAPSLGEVEEIPTLMEPAPARLREVSQVPPPDVPPPPPPSTPSPPALVVPSTVKYDGDR